MQNQGQASGLNLPNQLPGGMSLGQSMQNNPSLIQYLQNVQKPTQETLRECQQELHRFKEDVLRNRRTLPFFIFDKTYQLTP